MCKGILMFSVKESKQINKQNLAKFSSLPYVVQINSQIKEKKSCIGDHYLLALTCVYVNMAIVLTS